MISAVPVFLSLAGLLSTASAHAALWHPSMYGFNVTDNTFDYDNRPVVPLYGMTFDQWWLHGHINYPPKDGDFLELPAGGKIDTEISCDKGSTSYYASSPGGNAGFGTDRPCSGPTSGYHTTGIDDVKGCGLAIAYQPDVHALKPEDFVMFSINQTCVWNLHTEFEVPQLPACPEGGCHCAYFWIHSVDSGSQQIYMNAYKCKVTGNVGTQPLGKPMVPRRCGDDKELGRPAVPGNCTIGAKSPMYWYQKEGNNMWEDQYTPPYYNDLYGFHDGAQNDIFHDGVIASLASFTVGASATSHINPPPSTSAAQVTTHAAPPTSAPEPATSSVAEPATSSAAEPAATSAPEPATTSTPESSPTSEAAPSSSASSAQCRRKTHEKRNEKRHHARHLTGLHH